jgi:predicted TIM-barrel fold metal-dependent hydrolase
MDRFGIERAIVGTTAAAQHDPACADRGLLAQIVGHPRLRARWELLPVSTRETDLADTMRSALEHDVAAFELHPRRHGYPLDSDAVRDTLRAVADLERPLWIEHDQLSWQEAESLAEQNPALSIVISALGYRELRPLATLLDRRANVYVDTVNFSAHEGLEWLVERFGDRVVFATGCPQHDPAEAVTRLLLSSLDEPALLAAADGTAARLSGWREATT